MIETLRKSLETLRIQSGMQQHKPAASKAARVNIDHCGHVPKNNTAETPETEPVMQEAATR